MHRQSQRFRRKRYEPPKRAEGCNTASFIVGKKYRGPTTFYAGYALAPLEAVRAGKEDSVEELKLCAPWTPAATLGLPTKEILLTDLPAKDLIHVGTIRRGQNKAACRFLMNTDPASYVLLYTGKGNDDLKFSELGAISGSHESVSDVDDEFDNYFTLDDDDEVTCPTARI